MLQALLFQNLNMFSFQSSQKELMGVIRCSYFEQIRFRIFKFVIKDLDRVVGNDASFCRAVFPFCCEIILFAVTIFLFAVRVFFLLRVFFFLP